RLRSGRGAAHGMRPPQSVSGGDVVAGLVDRGADGLVRRLTGDRDGLGVDIDGNLGDARDFGDFAGDGVDAVVAADTGNRIRARAHVLAPTPTSGRGGGPPRRL